MSEKFTKLRPAPGKFVAIYDPPEEKKGVLFVPEQAKRTKHEATVLAIGDSYTDADGLIVRFPYAVGDRVVANPLWGTIWEDESTEPPTKYYIHSFKDGIAAVEGE
jgi:co-chaperonin GroES (HSP10)